MITTSFPRWEGDHAGHFVAALSTALVARGHDVTVLSPHEGSLSTEDSSGGVRIRRFRYLPSRFERVAYGDGIPENLKRDMWAVLGLPFFALALRRATKQLAHEVDIVHAHWAPTAALAAPWRSGVPVVLHARGSDIALATKGGIWRRLLSSACRGAAAVDVVTVAQRDMLVNAGIWSANDGPIEVIPSGIADELLDRATNPSADERVEIAYVGRMIRDKGVADLLEAFAAMDTNGVDVRLGFVGDGPVLVDLRARAIELGIQDRVVFHGALRHDEAIDIVAAADVLSLPSYAEGSPNVLKEAMALGLPVVASDVGGIPELVGDAGILHAPYDIAALAEALSQLTADPGMRERLGHAGRERIRESWVWSSIAQRTCDLYDRVLGSADEG
ncbi:MAG: glycosyltransferase [Actinomycetota bacterium]|nr:glycosyltransferase [Actinomycetota bacterium]